jgi:NADPH:quinone reductase-like Zn-dependent oxidoreductase
MASGPVARWEVTSFGDGGFVRRTAPPTGALGPSDVRLRMLAWTVNPRDRLMARGTYDPRIALPYVPLSDGVGEVVEIGSAVTRMAVGDRAAPTFSPGWIAGPPDYAAVRRTRGGPIPGVLAEELVLPEAELVPVPSSLSPVEAACLPCVGVTAWSAVVTFGRIAPGDTVLVLDSGGVALLALQIARMAGARVAAITSSEAKAEILRRLGAEHVVLRAAEPRWGRAVRRWADGGVDLVVETGGAATLGESLDAVRVGGTVAIIGVIAGARHAVDVLPILMRQIRCQGVFVGPRASFEDLVRACVQHDLHPHVHATVPFSAAPRAVLGDDPTRVGKVAIVREDGSEGAG